VVAYIDVKTYIQIFEKPPQENTSISDVIGQFMTTHKRDFESFTGREVLANCVAWVTSAKFARNKLQL
jgi:hypothetical protein